MEIDCKIDVSGLVRGIAAGRKFSRKALSKTINSALLHVAVDAQDRTPFVQVQTIDAELNAVRAAVVGRSGKALKGKASFTTGRNVRHPTTGQMVPLAALIIQAKAGGDNATLGKGFSLTRSPFFGVSRSLGAQKMRYYVDRLVKNRHRSTHFLASGWREAIEILKTMVSSGLRGQEGIGGQGLGSAIPAPEGDSTRGEMANEVGEQGPDAKAANEALWIHAAPALQAALDEEGRGRLNVALKKMGSEFQEAVQPHWR